MARIKHTARRTDKKGKLPPLGPPHQPDTDWGTADKTCYQHFKLPAHPVVANSSDYRRKCPTCSTYFINVYCTVHYVMFDIIDLNKYSPTHTWIVQSVEHQTDDQKSLGPMPIGAIFWLNLFCSFPFKPSW